MDGWDDNEPAAPAPASELPASGKTFGSRGRGFTPAGNRGDGGDGRKPFRPRNNGGDDGDRKPYNSRNGDDGDRKPFNSRNGDDGEGSSRKFRPRDGDGENENREEGAPEKPKPVSYIPEDTNEDELYSNSVNTGINFQKYDDIPVKVTGENVPPGITSFADSGLRKFLLEQIANCKYTVPTPVQKRAIPIIMAGRDVMGCAQTGSGKTAAFLLPIIHSLLVESRSLITDGDAARPQAVIVAPTRELAIQIWNEARKFTKGSSITCCIAYGGVQVAHQLSQMRNGVHILVATPGRLLDFVDKGRIAFDAIRFVVLDEADRMLEMGFRESVEKVMSHETMSPKSERQTLLFSATFPANIQDLAGKYLTNYLFITVGVIGGACADVEQRIFEVGRFEKKKKLVSILKEQGSERTLVFTETKRNADFLAVSLSENNFPTTSIHGDREQRQREEALRDFRSGRMHILIATAVASRGLDIKDVAHVINFDLPKEIDEYVHRIGRTGRLGNRGLATSFYDASSDSPLAAHLVRVLSQAGQEVPAFLVDGGGDGFSNGNSDFGGQDCRNNTGAQTIVAESVEDDGWD